MKNYSSNRAQKGKTAYRTASPFKVQKSMYEKVNKSICLDKNKVNKKILIFKLHEK